LLDIKLAITSIITWNTISNNIVITNGLSLIVLYAQKPHTSSTIENTGNRHENDTLKPSFNLIVETRYSNRVDTAIIPEFNHKLNAG
jgi:hypothetical protein